VCHKTASYSGKGHKYSHYAQFLGEFMRQEWRIYGISNNYIGRGEGLAALLMRAEWALSEWRHNTTWRVVQDLLSLHRLLLQLFAESRKSEHFDHIMHFIKHATQIGQECAADGEANASSDERASSAQCLRRA
jgi:hypothetical protein